MAKQNYNKMSAPKEEPVVEKEAIEETVAEEVVAEVPAKCETKKGVIANCVKVNVRSEPNLNASVVKVLNKGDSVVVDLSKSTDDFYAIDDGFCMKQYITIKD